MTTDPPTVVLTGEAMVPLVAMKLHAYLDRRRVAGPDQRPGDLWDIYHLLLHQGREAAADLVTGNPHLRDIVANVIRAQLVEGAAELRRQLAWPISALWTS